MFEVKYTLNKKGIYMISTTIFCESIGYVVFLPGKLLFLLLLKLESLEYPQRLMPTSPKPDQLHHQCPKIAKIKYKIRYAILNMFLPYIVNILEPLGNFRRCYLNLS